MNVNNAIAGTMESGDIMIQIFPADAPGIAVELESSVAHLFGDQIKKVIVETASGYGLDHVRIRAIDKGALDCTVRARVTAAAVRATGVDVWKD